MSFSAGHSLLHVEAQRTAASHWLRAVGDPQIGGCSLAMHGDMARLWTVEDLAAEGSMSRAGFAMHSSQLSARRRSNT